MRRIWNNKTEVLLLGYLLLVIKDYNSDCTLFKQFIIIKLNFLFTTSSISLHNKTNAISQQSKQEIGFMKLQVFTKKSVPFSTVAWQFFTSKVLLNYLWSFKQSRCLGRKCQFYNEKFQCAVFLIGLHYGFQTNSFWKIDRNWGGLALG